MLQINYTINFIELFNAHKCQKIFMFCGLHLSQRLYCYIDFEFRKETGLDDDGIDFIYNENNIKFKKPFWPYLNDVEQMKNNIKAKIIPKIIRQIEISRLEKIEQVIFLFL
jgi:hypothetical protein